MHPQSLGMPALVIDKHPCDRKAIRKPDDLSRCLEMIPDRRLLDPEFARDFLGAQPVVQKPQTLPAAGAEAGQEIVSHRGPPYRTRLGTIAAGGRSMRGRNADQADRRKLPVSALLLSACLARNDGMRSRVEGAVRRGRAPIPRRALRRRRSRSARSTPARSTRPAHRRACRPDNASPRPASTAAWRS